MADKDTTQKLGGKPLLKYLDIPIAGRGGVVRFFLISHGIDFDSMLFAPGTAWPEEKKRLVETGENPCGNVPVVKIGGKTLVQHVPIMRYLAREAGLGSGDAYGDFVQDAVADEHQNWRSALLGAAFGGSEEDKAAFRESVPGRLKTFEDLYTKYKTGSGPYLSVSPAGKGLWGDTAVFALLWDHVALGYLTVEQLGAYSHLKALYDAYLAQPAVAGWIQSKSASSA